MTDNKQESLAELCLYCSISLSLAHAIEFIVEPLATMPQLGRVREAEQLEAALATLRNIQSMAAEEMVARITK